MYDFLHSSIASGSPPVDHDLSYVGPVDLILHQVETQHDLAAVVLVTHRARHVAQLCEQHGDANEIFVGHFGAVDLFVELDCELLLREQVAVVETGQGAPSRHPAPERRPLGVPGLAQRRPVQMPDRGHRHVPTAGVDVGFVVDEDAIPEPVTQRARGERHVGR
jgi:hypothetical protein